MTDKLQDTFMRFCLLISFAYSLAMLTFSAAELDYLPAYARPLGDFVARAVLGLLS